MEEKLAYKVACDPNAKGRNVNNPKDLGEKHYRCFFTNTPMRNTFNIGKYVFALSRFTDAVTETTTGFLVSASVRREKDDTDYTYLNKVKNFLLEMDFDNQMMPNIEKYQVSYVKPFIYTLL